VRHRRFKLTTILLFGLGLTCLQAQESISTAGGNAYGSGGSVSYTAGQVVFTTNISTSGSVAHGVQQTYEIAIVSGIEDVKDISSSFIVYPNPTSDFLTLKVDAKDNLNLLKLSYQLYDFNGKLIENKKFESNETLIDMSKVVPASYTLKVIKANKEVKTFKIIKNQAK
jgi:hypothetical protein